MSGAKQKQKKGSSPPPKRKTPVLTIAFAIAMAFFLVIGAIAVGVTEFFAGNDTDPVREELGQIGDDAGNGQEEELRDRLEEDPEDDSALAQLAVLLANTGRVNDAIPYYEEALEHRPDDTELRLSFAQSLQQGGYTLDAQIQLERVLDEEPGNVEAMFLLAEGHERDGDQDAADDLYEQIIEADPDSFYAEMAEQRLAGEDAPPDDAIEVD